MTYFVSKGPEDQALNVGPSNEVIITSCKGEASTQGDETEDMEILTVSRDEGPTIKPPTGKLATMRLLLRQLLPRLLELRSFLPTLSMVTWPAVMSLLMLLPSGLL